jgi:chaperonin cofactor prefoldin
MVSESSFKRFLEDSAIDPDAMVRAAQALADNSLAEAIESLRAAVEDLRSNQARILQQMKDLLLLEVRNLKEQDRDLASFVFELAEEIRRTFPKKRR